MVSNTYAGPTTVRDSVLRAEFGQGLPVASNLVLNGGAYEPTSSTIFDRTIGTGGGQVQFGADGGGFAATGRTLTVRLNGGTDTLAWGSAGFLSGSGVLRFGAPAFGGTGAAADGTVDFRNGIDFAGGTRSVVVNSANPPLADLFTPRTAPNAVLSGVLSNGGVTVTGRTNVAVIEFAATNTYTGPTTVLDATLRARDGEGLPTQSALTLGGPVPLPVSGFTAAGGVLEGRGPTLFTRTLGTGAGQIRFDTNTTQAGTSPRGFGFSASGGTMTVRLNGGANLTWGTDHFYQGTFSQMLFGSVYSDATTDFQNSLDLGGAARTVIVRDNPTVAGDFTRFSGVISNGGLTKQDRGTLELTGANTYTGPTVVTQGAIRAVDGVGLPAASNLTLGGSGQPTVFEGLGTTTFTRSFGTGAGQVQIGSGGGGFAANGGVLTVQLNGGTGAITWPQFTLYLGSGTADNVADIRNSVNLASSLGLIATAAPGYTGPVGRLSGELSGSGGLTLGGSFSVPIIYQTGTVEVTAANTYTGQTSVLAGRLLVNNATGSGTGTGRVSVSGGSSNNIPFVGTLGGSGRIAPAANNNVDIFSAAGLGVPRLEPGGGSDNSLRIETSGTGQIRIGSTNSTAIWAVRVLNAGPGGVAAGSGGSTVAFPEPTNHTFLDLAGTVLFRTTNRYEIDGTDAGFTPGLQYSYAIGRVDSTANLNGGVPLSITDQSLFSTVGFAASDFSLVSVADGRIVLTFTPVPEPTAVLAIAAGAGLLLTARRRLARPYASSSEEATVSRRSAGRGSR